jgi:uncharacterized protein
LKVVLTTYTERHVPVRTCTGCRRRRAQHELVRCVLGDDGRAVVSRTAPGRGAWLCGPECVRAAIVRRGFDRAWRVRVAADALESLEEDLVEWQNKRQKRSTNEPAHSMGAGTT